MKMNSEGPVRVEERETLHDLELLSSQIINDGYSPEEVSSHLDSEFARVRNMQELAIRRIQATRCADEDSYLFPKVLS